MLAALEMPANFVPTTNAVLGEMQRRGISRDAILAELRRMGTEIPQASVELLQWAMAAGHDVRILSDCNSVFISQMLAGGGLSGCVMEVITNSASFQRVAGVQVSQISSCVYSCLPGMRCPTQSGPRTHRQAYAHYTLFCQGHLANHRRATTLQPCFSRLALWPLPPTGWSLSRVWMSQPATTASSALQTCARCVMATLSQPACMVFAHRRQLLTLILRSAGSRAAGPSTEARVWKDCLLWGRRKRPVPCTDTRPRRLREHLSVSTCLHVLSVAV